MTFAVHNAILRPVIRYTPIYNRLVDSSVWTLPDHIRIVWITMLALQDRDHVVRYTAFGIAQRAHKSEAEVLDALKVLSTPDTTRLEPQEHEGRRIEKHPDGWFILNGEKYQRMMEQANRREYKRQWMEKMRGNGAPKNAGSAAERLFVSEQHQQQPATAESQNP